MSLTLSNSLIIISFIFTLISLKTPEILVFGMNSYFIIIGNYLNLFFQFLIYSFLHGGFLHLIFNSIFIYIFGNKVEDIIGLKNYAIFFILTTIFNGIFILLLSNGNTIGISGFAMALLSFYTLKLYEVKNLEYKGGITAIIINVFIGLSSQISFVGHLFGVIFGFIYFYILKLKKF